MAWIGSSPEEKNRVALLIPQFNESSNPNFQVRLKYFTKIAEEFKGVMDVIVIDDGSTDESLQVIKAFKKKHNSSFFLASVSPNMYKVGALYATAASITHEFVILSDFDTDIKGMDSLFSNLDRLNADPSLMGCYFRMLPHEGKGSVFLFQQLEYSMSRVCYQFYKKESSVPVMPGAGCCYKRKLLVDIYEGHSGLRSGEDREATLIGLKLGYKTIYLEDIVTLTRPPLSYKSLLKQRVRWNLGYIETFVKERKFYYGQIGKLSIIGIRTLVDLMRVKLALLLPVLLLVGAFTSWQLIVMSLIVAYGSTVFVSVNAVLVSPQESIEFKGKRLLSILYYPFYKVPLEFIGWSLAIFSYFGKSSSRAPVFDFKISIENKQTPNLIDQQQDNRNPVAVTELVIL